MLLKFISTFYERLNTFIKFSIREGSFFHRNFEFLISLKIVSQYDVNSEFD